MVVQSGKLSPSSNRSVTFETSKLYPQLFASALAFPHTSHASPTFSTRVVAGTSTVFLISLMPSMMPHPPDMLNPEVLDELKSLIVDLRAFPTTGHAERFLKENGSAIIADLDRKQDEKVESFEDLFADVGRGGDREFAAKRERFRAAVQIAAGIVADPNVKLDDAGASVARLAYEVVDNLIEGA